jgi:hypothetical protein
MTTLRFLLRRPVKAKRIKLAARASCEICGRTESLEDLEVHSFLGEAEDQYSHADLERFLLILCKGCHRDLHTCSITVQEQEALIQGRPAPIRKNIRIILSYVPKSYTPPEIDLEEAYREASAPHHFGFGV